MSEPYPYPKRALIAGGVAVLAFLVVPILVISNMHPRSRRVLLPGAEYGIVWFFAVCPVLLVTTFALAGLGFEEAKRRWLMFKLRPRGPVAWGAAVVGPVVTVVGFVMAGAALESSGIYGKLLALPAALGLIATILGAAGVVTDLTVSLSRREQHPPLLDGEEQTRRGEGGERKERRDRDGRAIEGAGADAVTFACPHCGKKNRVPRAYAGKEGLCPGCKEAVNVPRS